MPCDYSLYPADWQERRARILKRALNECERCYIPNKAVVARFAGGVYGHLGNRLEWIASGGRRSGDECARKGIGWNTSYICHPVHSIPFHPRESVSYDAKHWSAPAVLIVLTIAHKPGAPMDCPDDQLEALCQMCHNRQDAPMRAKNAAKTRMARKAASSLFDGRTWDEFPVPRPETEKDLIRR